VAKDKVLRDARLAYGTWREEQTQWKLVRASPVDARLWAGPIRDEQGREFFRVSLLPPVWGGEKWRIVCSGNDDTSIVRDFTNEARARAVYDGINNFTQMKTLRGRGFRYD